MEEYTHNSIVLSWLSPLNRGLGSILAYHVERYTQKDKKWQTVTETCQGTSYKVRDLTPGTKYLFRIRAENMHGVSRPGLESDPIVLPLNDSADSVTSDMPTTFTRRGSNFLDSDSGVKTIVNRSLDGNDNLEHWSFPRQQKRRRSALDSLLKRPCSTTPRRMTYSPGFRDSMRIVKHNPLFNDSFEQSPEASPAKTLPLNMEPVVDASRAQLLKMSPLSESQDQITASQNDLDKDDNDLEMAVIITKDILPTLNSFSSLNSQNSQNCQVTDTFQNPESVPNSAKFSIGDKSPVEIPVTGSSVKSENSRKSPVKHSSSAEALPLQGQERLFEFDLDETGVKVPMKRLSSSTNGRYNVRKPLHEKLFIPPNEDSLEEYDIDAMGEKVPMQKSKPSTQSEEEPLSDAIDEIVHSLTSLYHSQLSLSESKPEALPNQEEITFPETVTRINQKVVEPLTSEYDGSASDSDEGRSTIPPVLPVFMETDTSCDDDPTDTSASSHDEISSGSEPDGEDGDSDSELSLTDYFGDESDDSADIDSFDEREKKKPLKPLDTGKVESLKEKVESQQQEVNVEIHADTCLQKVKHKIHHRSKLANESDSPVSEPNSIRTPRTFKHKLSSNQKPNSNQEVVPGSEGQVSPMKKVDSNPVLAAVFLEMENSDSVNSVTPNRQSLTSISSSLQGETEHQNSEKNILSEEKMLSENLPQNSTANRKTIDGDEDGMIKPPEAGGIDEEAWPSPPGSDEGVDVDTTSDTEVIIIHSTEVINRLHELMAKDPKLAEMLCNDPRFQTALNTNKILEAKPAREAKPKVSFADGKMQ